MLIVVMAWLYVIVIYAVAQTRLSATLAVLVFLGVLPVMLMGWLLRRRRRMRLMREQARENA
jgi:uncharacterized membrane protein YqjE